MVLVGSEDDVIQRTFFFSFKVYIDKTHIQPGKTDSASSSTDFFFFFVTPSKLIQ